MRNRTPFSHWGGAAHPAATSQARPVLLLAPSRDLGGGIERYVQTVESAFGDRGVIYRRIDLNSPGTSGHRALLSKAAAALAATPGPARLIAAHPALLPTAALLAGFRNVGGISVICHGIDVWRRGTNPRWMLESRLMRRADVRVVAVSSFTAGTLLSSVQATILPPGLSKPWFAELVSAADTRPPHEGIEIVTAFRLDDWQDKGLPQLTAAVDTLDRPDVRLTVCGTGQPTPELLAHISAHPWCTLRPRLTDHELASQLAEADLCVLATRTRSGRRPYGEGFGLVLLEAQVAGTAVVGPAHGGSPDAYLDGVTGVTPLNESVAALATVLDGLLRQPAELNEMGTRGAAWARARFTPDRYAALAISRLL